MKYTVSYLHALAWRVTGEDEEDIIEYIVNFNPWYEKFTCHCTWNVLTEKECKHIRMVRQFIVKRISEFYE